MAQYDVIIIGGGPGGYNAAIRAGQLGLKVAIVEGRETLGGTCLNVGCIPSKALLHASELYEIAEKDFAGIGIEVKPKLNLAQMMASKAESVTALTKGVEFLMKKNKVEWLKGWGRIAGPGKVSVKAADGTETVHEAKNIVIATGSEPSGLPGVTVDNRRIIDSTGALSIPEVPKSLIVIGAGVIGLELGSVWRRLGSKVTVIEYLDRITPGIDEETAKTFQRALTKQGFDFKLGAKVTGAKASIQAGKAAVGGSRTFLSLSQQLILGCFGWTFVRQILQGIIPQFSPHPAISVFPEIVRRVMRMSPDIGFQLHGKVHQKQEMIYLNLTHPLLRPVCFVEYQR